VGIDLDHVIQDGSIEKWAADIVDAFGSYTETSPSGSGVHIFVRASLEARGGKWKRDGRQVECYGCKRFFRMSGNVFQGRSTISSDSKALRGLEKAYKGNNTSKPVTEPSRHLPAAQSGNADVDSVVSFMRRFRNGDALGRLYDGDMTGYEDGSADGYDHSAADMALVNGLRVAAKGDAYLIDQAFRASGLYRPKWDQVHDGTRTYGQMTIEKALSDYVPMESTSPYRPGHSNFSAQNGPRPNVELAEGQGRDDASIATAQTYQQQDEPSKDDQDAFLDDTLQAYMENRFFPEMKHFQGYKERKTGLPGLDYVMGALYPGLYTIGAISSLGKTTLMLQIADNLATAGDDVIFFSLEQSQLELMTKILSRRAYLKGYRITANEIRRGDQYQDKRLNSGVMQAANDFYTQAAPRFIVVKCNFNMTVNDITDYVADYMRGTGRKPVVFIDYLQIVKAVDPRMTDKAAVDNTIKSLKVFQSDNDLVMFAVSSVNRANYLLPIDFESFKESGAIEFTSDVVWGLQLACLDEELFKKDPKSKLIEKRERVREAKGENPRKIKLQCLKNRFGRSDYSCNFDYYPAFDTFKDAR
jgi:replicative DNA helicase